MAAEPGSLVDAVVASIDRCIARNESYFVHGREVQVYKSEYRIQRNGVTFAAAPLSFVVQTLPIDPLDSDAVMYIDTTSFGPDEHGRMREARAPHAPTPNSALRAKIDDLARKLWFNYPAFVRCFVRLMHETSNEDFS